MKIYPVDLLNQQIRTDMTRLIAESEKDYHDSLASLAQQLFESRGEKPLILLSGPSGSAKTTTAHRLAALLKELGAETHVVSMDNYFKPLARDGVLTGQLGKLDLESPLRLDIPLLYRHFDSICRCEPVELPRFDFAAQDRRRGEVLHRKPGELIIFEGIHALNPEVTGSVQQQSLGIYVSVRTRLSIGERLLHPEKIRLMRRLMRDHQFRGREITDIMMSYVSVQQGEQLYIMPHKHRAAFDIDTFMPFEAAVYKKTLLPLLEQVPKTHCHYELISDVMDFLGAMDDVPTEAISPASIVREFAGGSSYGH